MNTFFSLRLMGMVTAVGWFLTSSLVTLSARAQEALPLGFPGSVTGSLASDEWRYYKVAVPAGAPGFRVVAKDSAGKVQLFARKNELPDSSQFDARTQGESFQNITTLVVTNAISAAETWFVGVLLPSGAETPAAVEYTLRTDPGWLRTLEWDPGRRAEGTSIFPGATGVGGDFWFKVTVQNTSVGAWRAALKVASAAKEADLFLRDDQFGVDVLASKRAGSDGFVVPSLQFEPGKELYLLVRATETAEWSLQAGEVFVHDLGPLAADATSGTNVVVQPEGVAFFKTTIPAETLAWRLWLNGAGNPLRVRKDQAPLPDASDLARVGKMLVVPDYLGSESFNGSYFVAVPGDPDTRVNLDSRRQAVANLDFTAQRAVTVTAGEFPYLTFRVQVPVQQIAWQLNLTPASGNADLAVRRDKVPNEGHNTAFSEFNGAAGDSITLAPPTLSDGTFYVTVYGGGAFSATLASGQPVITDTNFVFSLANDAPNRVGWRFYRVANIDQQLGSLGWEVLLANQAPGTRIALRRNAVPAIWNGRDDENGFFYETSFVDHTSAAGFLQRPNHPADIWYVGIYSPDQPLGAFALQGKLLVPAPLVFDGAGASAQVTALPGGKWTYFRVEVPATAAGWDLRLADVTQGSGALALRRQQLPEDGGLQQVSGVLDPTGYSFEAGGGEARLRMLSGALKNYWLPWYPNGLVLEPGVYYVGVKAEGEGPLSARLSSRGIGDGLAIPIRSLAFTGAGGTVTIADLPPRELAYFKLTVPASAPSWRLKLTPTRGDGFLLFRKGGVPGTTESISFSSMQYGQNGWLSRKPGVEHFAVLPVFDRNVSGEPVSLLPGDYIVAVASEGADPDRGQNRVGAASASFTLSSLGPLPVTGLGLISETGYRQSHGQEGGETRLYQFTVPVGAPALEVSLEDRVGAPAFALSSTNVFVTFPQNTHGLDGGDYFGQEHRVARDLVTVANPPPGTYSLLVQAGATDDGSYPDATYTLRVRILPPRLVDFASSDTVVAGQASNSWRFYRVEVPTNALAWDLRVTGVSGGKPGLLVRKALLPAWGVPDINQWAGGIDLTGFYAHPDGSQVTESRVLLGIDRPLAPGTYYVGVQAAEGETSYTLRSRGVGDGLPVEVAPLNYANGRAVINNLPPRELAWFKVQTPAGPAPWKLRLSATTGDLFLIIFKHYVNPLTGEAQSYVQRVTRKPGDEEFTFLPFPGYLTESEPVGTYYFTVVSEGDAPLLNESKAGERPASGVLTSVGAAPIVNLGTAGDTDLKREGTLAGGETALYRFTVPPGVASLEVRLLNRTGNPNLGLSPTNLFANLSSFTYGLYGGWSISSDPDLLVVPTPVPGEYSVTVYANTDDLGIYAPASYTLNIHTVGVGRLEFDGGTQPVTGQPGDTWRYFLVTVPEAALGWDARLLDVTSGTPDLWVQKAELPKAEALDIPGGVDWSGRIYAADGSLATERVVQLARGQNYRELTPGTWYVGVFSRGGPASYTLLSRGIGAGYRLLVNELPLSGGVTGAGLPPRDSAFYRLVVPENTAGARFKLTPTLGEAMLVVARDHVPSLSQFRGLDTFASGAPVQKPGVEFGTLLRHSSSGLYLDPGSYYLAVVSEGRDPQPGGIGVGGVNFTLSSSPVEVLNLGDLGAGITRELSQDGGETRYFQYNVAPGTRAVEVRLENRVGNPLATINPTNALFAPEGGAYGVLGLGFRPLYLPAGPSVITLPEVSPGVVTLAIHAGPNDQGEYPNAAYRLRIGPATIPELKISGLAGGSGSEVVTGQLADGQSAFYRVSVPAALNGDPLLGWRLDLSSTNGNPRVRVRPGLLPAEGTVDTVEVASAAVRTALIVPPVLMPGAWFVEVRGAGASSYTVRSSVVTTNPANGGLQRVWAMPAAEVTTAPPGLSFPTFADSGVVGGAPASADGGTDLEQGNFDLYQVDIPSNNAKLLRVELQAISGTANLYVRRGGLPTLSHGMALHPFAGPAYEQSLVSTATQYANWVPLNGLSEAELTPGRWFLAVHAAGGANLRYRLKLASGNLAPGKLVQALPIGASLANQILAKDDWRYYRFEIPADAPERLALTLGESVGDVQVYVRDTLPPGIGVGPGASARVLSWSTDGKNSVVPSGIIDRPETHLLTTPPLRPGGVYYLGVTALKDSTFSLALAAQGGVRVLPPLVNFFGGEVSQVLPARGSRLFRVAIPRDAAGWIIKTTNAPGTRVLLEEGTFPLPEANHLAIGEGTNRWQEIFATSQWPFRPGSTFFVMATNDTDVARSFTFVSDGRTAATADYNDDGILDAWQDRYFGSAYAFNAAPGYDADGDGVNNLQEFRDGTDPTDPTSFRGATGAPRVTLLAEAGESPPFAPVAYTLEARVDAVTGTVTRMEFFAGAVKLGELTGGPYRFAWSAFGAGTYQLTAKATDDTGRAGISAPVTVNVLPSPEIPTVLADGSVQLRLRGVLGRRYRVEFSNDLVTWSLLREITIAAEVETVPDGNATRPPAKHYRMMEAAP